MLRGVRLIACGLKIVVEYNKTRHNDLVWRLITDLVLCKRTNASRDGHGYTTALSSDLGARYILVEIKNPPERKFFG